MNGTWKLRLRLWLVTLLMFVIVFALVAIVCGVTGYRMGFGLYFFISIGIMLIQYLAGPSLVKHTMAVKPVTPQEEPRIHAMVEEMSLKAGIPKPEVGISQIGIPNAFAYGRSKRSGHIAVTAPIIGLLDDDELRAVIGHEIGHIKHNDMIVTTVISVLPMICYYLALSFLFSRDQENAGFMIIVGILGYAAYLVGQLLVLFVSRIREYYADQASVEFGNKPSALVSGLYKLSYGAARASEETIKNVNTNRAFFANDINHGERDVACFQQIDFDHDGKISDEDLEKFYRAEIVNSFSDNFTELLSTHPDSLKRARRLAELEFEN